MPPAGTNVSIEREVFPTLVGHGLYGYESSGYWMDIGTPDRYLQATYDILEGKVSTEVGRELGDRGLALVDGADVEGRVVAPVLVAAGCSVAPARAGRRSQRARRGRDRRRALPRRGVGPARGRHGRAPAARSARRSSVAASTIGEHCHIEGGVMLGEGVKIGSGNTLAAGARIFPGVELPDGAIRF